MSNRHERREDARTTSHLECLNVIRRIYDMTGQPDLKAIIERAEASLGRIPADA